MNLGCRKCQKPLYIQSRYKIDGVNKLHFECIDCGFEIIMGFDEECLEDYIKKLNAK